MNALNTLNAPRQVVLCVDDFGLKPQVNEAVANLADAGLVTAVGCMSTAPAWASGAALLKGARRERLDVGLHLNLTDPMPGTGDDLVMPLARLVAMSLLRALPADRLIATIEHQLACFEAHFGALPDFIDGHQHVHQLPQVREALMAVIDRRRAVPGPGPGEEWTPWLRLTATAAPPSTMIGWKHRVIETLGARGLQALARSRGLPMNRALLGVYGFDGDSEGYRQRLAQWMRTARDGDLLMMHPAVSTTAGVDEVAGVSALAESAGGRPPHGGGVSCTPTRLTQEGHPTAGAMGDSISRAREVEYAVLSRHGRQMLQECGVQPQRLTRISGILNH